MTGIVEYTDPATLSTGVAEGWAESVTDPTTIDWPVRQAAAAVPFKVVGCRPVNPCEITPVRYGRNGLGLWGENLMADGIVTCRHAGTRWLLLVERGDGHGWAVPGGSVESGETATAAAARETAEETALPAPAGLWRPGYPVYVPDPRASDEAWAVTVPAYADLGAVDRLPTVTGADDARRAAWVRAESYRDLCGELRRRFGGAVFAAHAAMLRAFCDAPEVAA